MFLAAACALSAVNLTVDYLPAAYPLDGSLPRVSDLASPRLGWLFTSASASARNKYQSAYRIQVASTAALLSAGTADVWDSGRVNASTSVAVPYGGPVRPSRSQSVWRVEVWDEAGASCGAAAAPAAFGAWEVPLLVPSDWEGAQWLTAAPPPATPPTDCDLYQPDPAPLFRADVSLAGRPPLLSARAYVVGLGYFSLLINGQPLPQAGALDPPLTTFNKTILYSVQDATGAVAAAVAAAPPAQPAFTVAVALGNGWWNPLPLRFWGARNFRAALPTGPPMFKLALRLAFADGSTLDVTSRADPGAGWRVGPSEVQRNNIYLGTVVNRSAEPPAGWATPAFGPAALLPPWGAPVQPPAPPPAVLRAASVPPVRRQASIAATLLSSVNGTHIYDAGTNMAGVCQWCLGGASPGQALALRYGEVLFPDGSLNGLTSVAGQIKRAGEGGPCAPDIAWQADAYTARGDAGGECYTPPWTWHGFRYIEVSGSAVAGAPLASLTCYPMRSDLARTSTFASSSPLLQRIHAMEVATQAANLMSIQSDCPHRERQGYGGDALMTLESLLYNFDTALFSEKRAQDFADAARPDGGLTETAPYVGISDAGMSPQGGPIGWQAYLPSALAAGLRYHGNALAVREQYGAVSAFMALLAATPAERIEGGLGDWMTLEPSPLGMTGWGFALQSYAAYAELAAEVGDAGGAAAGAAGAAAAGGRLNAQYLDPLTPGLYRCTPASNCSSPAHFNNSQCAQALALHLGIVPPSQRPAAVALLAANLAAQHGHLAVGGFGIGYLLRALGDAGRADLSYGVMAAESYPSYGFMLQSNASTMWESWSYSASTFSHNHPMFSGPTRYIFQSLAGIRVAPAARGASVLQLVPQPPPYASGLLWQNSSWVSVRGAVHSDWAWVSPSALQLRLVVPFNTQAQLTLPLSQQQHVLGSGEWLFTDTAAA
jgi:alpha-L-rhamnosidase